MKIVRTLEELNHARAGMIGSALVPTMGALHAGHAALLAAAGAAGPVIASVFVNPLQFGPGEDLARYPRDEAADLTLLERAGCALAFLPAADEIYGAGDATTITVAGPALGWEGARRPGHFAGVATIVAKLFMLTGPSTAWFGQKDWQQLQVIRRMVADLHWPVAIHDVATMRAEDGLALSSRNRFLGVAERALAPHLAALCGQAAAQLAEEKTPHPTLANTRAALSALGFAIDYLALVDPESLIELTIVRRPARLIVAAQLGSVRLLDNFPV